MNKQEYANYVRGAAYAFQPHRDWYNRYKCQISGEILQFKGSQQEGAIIALQHELMDIYAQFQQLVRMDEVDLKILAILQEDASVSVGEVANQVGLSQTPCWRRINRLEQSGVILRRVALLDPDAIGLGLTVFVEIESGDHSKEWLDRFAAAVVAMPEVMEVHRMAGDVDYLLRIAAADMASFDLFYRELIALLPLKNVTSRFAMESVKRTTAYPIPAAAATPRRKK